MDSLESLIDLFHYDLWANRQWLSHLGGFKKMDRPLEILEHILLAQHRSLVRAGVEFGENKKDMPLSELFADSVEIWTTFLKDRDLDEPVTYLSNDREYTHSLGKVATHVINHGTYHRGHLRGLAEAEGLTDFPDTDYLLYLREKQG